MRRKALMRTALNRATPVLGILVLATMAAAGPASARAGGSPPMPTHFSGLLNDYTPTSDSNTGNPISGSPYEMHGRWTLDLNAQRGTATFSAEMTMETSEVANASSVFDPGSLGAHTHHISVTDGVVHNLPTDWQTMCPALKPAASGGFAVTGSMYLTANGSNPPFGNPSPVTICILGATGTGTSGTAYVQYSNLTMTIGEKAAGHFGTAPIHGVVTRCGGRLGLAESPNCRVVVQ
ncbi:MAG TPA: hypothetical protein VN630_00755 [Rhodanobacteraceae bacterium]|nr:hypothetical protein [Rhodanobacteraceae bacterium]